jgi:hypothetical protein
MRDRLFAVLPLVLVIAFSVLVCAAASLAALRQPGTSLTGEDTGSLLSANYGPDPRVFSQPLVPDESPVEPGPGSEPAPTAGPVLVTDTGEEAPPPPLVLDAPPPTAEPERGPAGLPLPPGPPATPKPAAPGTPVPAPTGGPSPAPSQTAIAEEAPAPPFVIVGPPASTAPAMPNAPGLSPLPIPTPTATPKAKHGGSKHSSIQLPSLPPAVPLDTE